MIAGFILVRVDSRGRVLASRLGVIGVRVGSLVRSSKSEGSFGLAGLWFIRVLVG